MATLFLLAALSLAGLPPLSGFFGKFILIEQGWNQGQYALTGFMVATSLLTLLSMLKIWSYGFWSPAQGDHVDHPQVRPHTIGGIAAVGVLVALALSMGLGAQQYFDASRIAAKTLVDPTRYVTAVLGEDALIPRHEREPGLFAEASR